MSNKNLLISAVIFWTLAAVVLITGLLLPEIERSIFNPYYWLTWDRIGGYAATLLGAVGWGFFGGWVGRIWQAKQDQQISQKVQQEVERILKEHEQK